jgi:hypothetical protein
MAQKRKLESTNSSSVPAAVSSAIAESSNSTSAPSKTPSIGSRRSSRESKPVVRYEPSSSQNRPAELTKIVRDCVARQKMAVEPEAVETLENAMEQVSFSKFDRNCIKVVFLFQLLSPISSFSEHSRCMSLKCFCDCLDIRFCNICFQLQVQQQKKTDVKIL